MNWDKYECDGQMSIFDLEEPTETKFNPLEALALCGTGFHDGMFFCASLNDETALLTLAEFAEKAVDYDDVLWANKIKTE